MLAFNWGYFCATWEPSIYDGCVYFYIFVVLLYGSGDRKAGSAEMTVAICSWDGTNTAFSFFVLRLFIVLLREDTKTVICLAYGLGSGVLIML